MLTANDVPTTLTAFATHFFALPPLLHDSVILPSHISAGPTAMHSPPTAEKLNQKPMFSTDIGSAATIKVIAATSELKGCERRPPHPPMTTKENIIAALTTDGPIPTTIAYAHNANIVITVDAFRLQNNDINNPTAHANTPTCKPLTASTCAVPQVANSFRISLLSSLLSPNVNALKNPILSCATPILSNLFPYHSQIMPIIAAMLLSLPVFSILLLRPIDETPCVSRYSR